MTPDKAPEPTAEEVVSVEVDQFDSEDIDHEAHDPDHAPEPLAD